VIVPSPPKLDWPGTLRWGRALLAGLALSVTCLFPPRVDAPLYVLLWSFLFYSVFVAITGSARSGMLGLLALFGDTVYFLIVAASGRPRLLWLAAAFFLYLMGEALEYYGPVEVVIITALSAVFCAVHPDKAVRQLESTVAVAGVLGWAFAISRRRLSMRLENASQQFDEARKAAEKAREQERQRIASDFHDGPLQSFISLQMRLEILRKLLERDVQAGMEDLKQLQTLAQAQVRDLRVFLHSMRPVDVGGNVIAAARRAAESFQKESGIPVTFLGADAPVGLPQETTSEVLQMVREALHNVQKHAAATRVALVLEKTDRGLEISVEDNGHGFSFAGSYSLEELELLRLGPASLKRRARSLNAEMLLESRPGRGAGLKFRIPLQ
jgi:signal transduction histidine kinase